MSGWLILVAVLAVLVAATWAGTDSRDGLDWRPTRWSRTRDD